jgi:hypothetical protein
MINDPQFQVYAKKLRDAFPVWTAIRKDPEAIGAQFLSVAGISLDDVVWILNYAYEQQYIGTADIDQTDLVYKALIPNSLNKQSVFRVESGANVLTASPSMLAFLSQNIFSGVYGSIQSNSTYVIDFTYKTIYVHDIYTGSLSLTVTDNQGIELAPEVLTLLPHQVWNFFDEFGLLLALPRLSNEHNLDYKTRLLDVFKRKPSSTYQGLMNAIGRELDLIRHITWPDGGVALHLAHNRIPLDTILVDDESYPTDHLTYDSDGRVVLLSNPLFNGVSRKVSYISGVELHELHNKSDVLFQHELFQIDGSATALLQYYVGIISNRVPIKWGEWKWNQGFWDVSNVEMSGYGYIPNFYDARFSGWKSYVPKEG